jgi:import inner membrane translocase subunit TIM23
VASPSIPKSPYLNFDPGYVAKPEFILPEGASKTRGRFELAFGQIGASCMLGAALGGSGGLYNGLKQTTLAGQTGKLRRTQ